MRRLTIKQAQMITEDLAVMLDETMRLLSDHIPQSMIERVAQATDDVWTIFFPHPRDRVVGLLGALIWYVNFDIGVNAERIEENGFNRQDISKMVALHGLVR